MIHGDLLKPTCQSYASAYCCTADVCTYPLEHHGNLPTGCTGRRHRMARPDAAPRVMPSFTVRDTPNPPDIETLAVTFSHWTASRPPRTASPS